jgi:hypothetical protein
VPRWANIGAVKLALLIAAAIIVAGLVMWTTFFLGRAGLGPAASDPATVEARSRADMAAQAAAQAQARDAMLARKAEAEERAAQAATAAAIKARHKARCQVTTADGRTFNCP